MLTMHMNSETTLDFLDGRLDHVQEDFWKQHLELCGGCTESLGQWEEVRFTLKRSHLKSAPAEDLERAFNIFPHRIQESGSRLRRVLAVVMFDSFLEPSLAGARGVAAAARQIVLHAEEFDIHLQIWGEQDRVQVLGQMLPRTAGAFATTTARLHLLRNGERLETTLADDIGEFQFADVPEGDLSLQIDLPNLTVIAALNMQDAQ
jgi:hypothetical protein